MVDNLKDRPNIFSPEELKKDLLSRPVPSLSSEQLESYKKYDDLGASPAFAINFEKLPRFFKNNQGREVLVFDLGGNKVEIGKVVVKENNFVINENLKGKYVGKQGKGQLGFLEKFAKDKMNFDLPVGISTAGVVEGTVLKESPNKLFYQDFIDKYGGDFEKLFPRVVVLNDAVAGLIAGIIYTKDHFPTANNILYLVDGEGLGLAALMIDTIWSTEAGHITAQPKINPYKIKTPCRLYPDRGVCVENVSASGSFIEPCWEKLTGEKINGREIEKRYCQGDKRVADLYDASAVGLAHALVGLGNVWSLWNKPEEVAVVLHGGGFKAAGVAERVMQIIENHFGQKFNYVITHSFSDNACLEGAGIAKLLTDNLILKQI
jgi:predicted NBD/HSP70 family sugar kinase